MKARYTTILLVLPLGLSAQPQLPGFNNSDTVTIRCPQDTTRYIHTYEGWEAYQTLDDTWYGPKDTTICIDLFHFSGQWPIPGIAIDQIDTDRPVFIRALYTDDNFLELATSNKYAIGMELYTPGGFSTETCPSGPCSGAIGAVRIPDITGLGSDLRWYEMPMDQDDFSPYAFQLCVPTEKFDRNDLREFILSIKPEAPVAGQYISGFYSEIADAELWGTLVRLTDLSVPNYRSGQFSYSFGPFSWEDHLVIHPDTTYPDADHIGYLDLNAVPNVATPTTITATLGMYTGFAFQPYAQLRGGLVLGSDSVRHPLTVINDGADLCMGWQFIEVVWDPGSSYIHNSGHIDFQGSRSCFLFHAGSNLEVGDGTTFHYGKNGRGMLALMNGSNVVIGSGAELVMHGTLIIKEAPGTTEHQDMHMTLHDGAKLTFAPGSRIFNANSIHGAMQLVVTLDGGSVDISGLGPDDRPKVRVIELPKEQLTAIKVMGNPTSEELVLSFSSRQEGSMTLRCIDAMGRPVLATSTAAAQGPNTLRLSVNKLTAGVYFLESELGAERQVIQFVKD